MTAIARASEALGGEGRGALGMCLAMLIFICMDAMAKHLSETLPPLQVVWARYAGQTVLVALIFLPRLRTLARSRAPGLQLVRSVFLFAATSLYFTGLSELPLAEATALMEVGPLFITLLAGLYLGEQVGPRRWAGVIAGLVGALIIIRPGLGVFQPASLFVLGAAFCIACYQVATRRMSGHDSIWTTMLYTTLFGTVAASLAMPAVWVTPPVETLPLLAVIGVVGFAGHLSLTWALGQAPASVLAPFNYSQLLWSILIGWMVFAELPDRMTVAGAAVIVGAGLYVWHRERVRRRPAAPPARPGNGV